MDLNFKLKYEICKKYNRQCHAAKKLGIDEVRLSRIINRWIVPKEKEILKLEKALKMSREELEITKKEK